MPIVDASQLIQQQVKNNNEGHRSLVNSNVYVGLGVLTKVSLVGLDPVESVSKSAIFNTYG